MRVFLAYLLLSQTALAVPGQFTHQGRLLDADGMALEDEATITFRIADAESGGTNLWEETQTVSLTNGFYSAILGADEDDNPLDIEVLSQAPVWLELQLDGEGAMFPRSPVHSVPYAAIASVAEELVGGPVDAETVAVGGVPVINEAGEWVGPASSVSWSDIEGMPEDFADGVDDDTDTDSDSLAELATSCLDGDIPVWDGVVEAWACDFDQDTLAGIGCLDGQLIHWSGDSMGWVCADDVDTFLTEEDVDSMVADNGYAMASEVFSGSFLDLVDVPAGLEDGDDNTQLSEADVDEMVSDNGYAMGTDMFSGSFGDLVDVPAGLEDGDDDTLAALTPTCEGGATLKLSSITGNWECITSSGSPVTVTTEEMDEVPSGGTLKIETASGSSALLAQAWVQKADGSWQIISQGTGMEGGGCEMCGDGSDGEFDEGGDAVMELPGGEYNFTDFVVPSWLTIKVISGSGGLLIRATGLIDIQGTISVNGEDGVGGSGSCAGRAAYGGQSPGGGSGGSHYSSGAGPGGGERNTNGTYGEWSTPHSSWLLYQTVHFSQIRGGSGGGAGCESSPLSRCAGSYPAAGGGAGGGILAIFGTNIDVSGSLTANGGRGGSCPTVQGGNGSGGAVYLKATTANISGTITGAAIRVDSLELTAGAALSFVTGATVGIPPLHQLYQPSSGIVEYRNNTGETQKVRLVVAQ